MFDDLINKPYKVHGRGPGGYDCYGLVIECCRRAGTPLLDLWYDVPGMESGTAESEYINKGLNVRKIDKVKKGCLVEMEYNGKLHAGYMIDRDHVMHTTERGVKVTCLPAVKVKAFYEVLPV